jgi:hypothetical protein
MRAQRPVDPRELLVFEQVGALDQEQEVAVLLTRVGVESDPAVEGGLDRRAARSLRAGVPSTFGRPSMLFSRSGVHRARDVHHLEQREVDVLAEPVLARAPHGGERATARTCRRSTSEVRPPAITGGCATSPRVAIDPHSACTVNSVAGRPT